MHQAVVITSAQVADIHLIRNIALSTWPVAYADILSTAQLRYMLDLMYTEKALHDQMTLHGHYFLLAHMAGEALGFASYSALTDLPGTTRLHKLYVLPGKQGHGIGAAMLDAVVRKAMSAGNSHLELNVNRFNKALDFYKRQGFRVIRDEQIDIGQGFIMDDHVLQLELPRAPRNENAAEG